MKTKLEISSATRSDVAIILGFIRQLAEFEKLSHQVTATEAELERTLFCEKPTAEVLIGRFEGKPVCFSLFFHNYSTFLAKPGIYLEDLFVLPAMRGRGFGEAMLRKLAQLAVERGCGRLEWSVLNWNERAIKFYQGLGSEPMNEWTVHRVTGEALKKLSVSRSGG